MLSVGFLLVFVGLWGHGEAIFVNIWLPECPGLCQLFRHYSFFSFLLELIFKQRLESVGTCPRFLSKLNQDLNPSLRPIQTLCTKLFCHGGWGGLNLISPQVRPLLDLLSWAFHQPLNWLLPPLGLLNFIDAALLSLLGSQTRRSSCHFYLGFDNFLLICKTPYAKVTCLTETTYLTSHQGRMTIKHTHYFFQMKRYRIWLWRERAGSRNLLPGEAEEGPDHRAQEVQAGDTGLVLHSRWVRQGSD